MRRTSLVILVVVAIVAVGIPASAADTSPNMPISCESLWPYFCGLSCLNYMCSVGAQWDTLCKEGFAGGSSCVSWPHHRCCSDFRVF